MKSFAEFIDFTSPAEAGGGSSGIAATRAFLHPNVFFGWLTAEKTKFFLYEDHGGATCRLLKAVIPRSRVLQESQEYEQAGATKLVTLKFMTLKEYMFEDAKVETRYDDAARAIERELDRQMLACLRGDGLEGDRLQPCVLKMKHTVAKLAFMLSLWRQVVSALVCEKLDVANVGVPDFNFIIHGWLEYTPAVWLFLQAYPCARHGAVRLPP